MPIQTRCPSCSAAVPPSAAWCSLCHADLRPKPDPDPVLAVAPVADLAAEPSSFEDAEPRGRHSAAPPVAPRHSSGGRHAAGGGHAALRAPSRTATPTTVRVEDLMSDLEIPPAGEATPDAVEALADQMLSRLSVTESRPNVLDPRDLPGGPWGFAAAVGAAVVVVLLLLGTLIGFLISR